MRALYQIRAWALIRPLRWFYRHQARASFGLRLLPEKNEHYKYLGGLPYRMPNVHWWILYKTVGKFSLWLYWDAWRVFCDWTGGWRRTYPWPARLIHDLGRTLTWNWYGGACYHCAAVDGDPVDLSNDETGTTFKLIEAWTEGTQDGTDHRFRGITTCPKCGYQQEYEDGSL